MYVFTRIDIGYSHSAIQAGHAALEAGIKHGPSPDGHPSLIYLEARDQDHLLEAKATIAQAGLKLYEFHEPYQDWGLTAFACEPIPQDKRALFKGFNLWRK